MAKIRFGYSDDFTAKNNKIGINTTIAQENVDVVGVVKGKDLRVTGVSSQTGYEGFLREDHQIEEETQLNFGQGINASLSGEIIVGTGQTVTVNEVVKETVAVGNNDNTLWHNLVAGKSSGVIDRSPADKGAFWNGESFDFDGSNDVITGESCLTLFTDDTDHTIEVWVKFDDVTTRRTIISGYKSGDADRWDLEVNSGKLKGGHHDQGYFTSTASVITGRWYHLVYVHDHASSLWRVFINTATDVTYANAGRDLTSDIALGIGDRKDSSIGHLDGQISIVRIYNRELTSTEISTNYNLGQFSKETSVTDGLITHYNASNPSSYPGTLGTVDTTNTNIAGGSQIECMKVYNTFTPPAGGTNERPYAPKPGELYYNYDFKVIEFYDGYGWRQVDYTTQSGRGLIGGGAQPSDTNKSDTIESIQIQSLGGATDFGNLTQARRYVTSCSSSIRGVWAGGLYPTATDIIDYVTIASGGNALDFGNIVTSDGTTSNVKSAASSCSSSTRGIFAGGYRPAVSNGINYIEIATTGNALVFGELIQPGYYGSGCSSSVRGVFQGHTNNNSATNYEMITIASKGDAVDFGEVNWKRTANSMLSNSTRGINAGGYNALSPWFSFTVNSIEYITLSSSGSAEYFGDLTRTNSNSFQGCATSARGVFCGGFVPTPSPGVYVSTCDYVTIASTGNATDFGDLNDSRRALGQCSDSHGGLGGF